MVAAAALVVATSLLGAACTDAGGDNAEAPSSTTSPTSTEVAAPDPDLAPPDEPGPYAVGRRVIQIEDAERGRPLVADVWYPVEPGTAGQPSVYSFLPGIEFASDTALADAPVSPEGPFPLVVYSHGSGGLRYVASFFTELLASHGFVVAAVDHVGNTAVELVTGNEPERDQVSLDRVLDVGFVIDEMLAAAQRRGDPFEASVDAERIGVTGHSYGGFTTFATVSGFSNELGEAPADERVDALVAMAPASELNPIEDLEAVDVPTLLVSGTEDVTTPIDPDTERAWDSIPGRPLWRVDLTDAGHQSFTDVCDYQELLPTLDAPELLVDAVDEFAEEGCSDELVPIDEAHRLINRASVAFLLAHVAGEVGYEAFLAEELPGEVVQVKQ